MFENGRGIGITDALHGAAEWPIVVLFGVVTQLGDGWFLFALVGSLYVAGDALSRHGIDRRRGAFVLGVLVTYVGLIGLLKAVFQLPRPPGAAEGVTVSWLPPLFAVVLDSMTTGHGFGFPSGHALGSTMVWGSLALVLRWRTLWTRVVAAGVLVTLISLSRLVLGVHYAVDVVVGTGVGVIALGALYWVADEGSDPGRTFLVAVVVGAVGLYVSITFESVATAGGAVGGWIVWRQVADDTPVRPATGRELFAGFTVLGVTAVLFGALEAVEPPLLITFFGAALAVGGVVVAPLLAERVA